MDQIIRESRINVQNHKNLQYLFIDIGFHFPHLDSF